MQPNMDPRASSDPVQSPHGDGPAVVCSSVRGDDLTAGDNLGVGRAWQFLCLAEIVNFADLRRHLGRQRADRLALDVATRIEQVLPNARLAVISRTLVEATFVGDDRADLRRALSELEDAFASPAEFEHERYVLRMVFGAAAAHALGCDEIRLAEEAEEALARERHDRRTEVQDLPKSTPALDSGTLTAELPAAIATGQLFLQFQPKLHLRRREILGVEALVRWEHPVRGLILPGDFIPSAESSRHIRPLTLWTLRQGIADQHRLAERGYDVPVFINISGRLLGDEAFVTDACALLSRSAAKIGFEITETAVIRDPDAAIANLQRFADIGVPIAIDDYGAGLSSLSYLKRLPATELKIDKMFVTQLASSNRDPLIVRSTIDLAHALEMKVTAEGVEDQKTMALLSVMGCDMAQGYLISRPIGLGALLQYLDDEEHLKVATDPRAGPEKLLAVWKRA